MIRPAFHSLVLIASAVLLGSCGKKTTALPAGPAPLATVGGAAILPADLLNEISWRQANNQFVPPPEALLQEMVTRLATVQRARKEGVDKDPETKRRMETQLIAGLRATTMDKRITAIDVSEAAVEEAYKASISRYTRKSLDRFAILFVAANSKSSETLRSEARGKLEAALKLATENPAAGGRGPSASGFGPLSIDYSEDQASRHRGGDIGWIEEGAVNTRFPEKLLAAGTKLEIGAISEIITTDDGFYLIRKTDSRPGGVRPLTDVADELRHQLLRDRRNAIEQSFAAETLAAASPEINRAALDAMKLQAAPAPAPSEPPAFPGVSSAR